MVGPAIQYQFAGHLIIGREDRTDEAAFAFSCQGRGVIEILVGQHGGYWPKGFYAVWRYGVLAKTGREALRLSGWC